MSDATQKPNNLGSVPLPSPSLAEDILHVIQTIVFVVDGNGQIVFVSASSERVFGFKSEQLLGNGFFELVQSCDGQDRKQRQADLAQIALGKVPPPPRPYASCLLAKSGEPRWILWHDSKGPGDLLIGAGQDITDLRRAEDELNRREAEFRAIFERSSDGMMILDTKWHYVEVNPAACRIWGLKAEDVLAREQGTVPKSNDDISHLRAKAEEGIEYSAEVEFQRPDGDTRTLDLSVVPNFREGHHLIVMRDITDRRRLEMQLAQAQKLEAVGRLAGGVAHDFNNMLTAIRGYAELLTRNLDDNSPQRRYVNGVLNAAEHAAQTTQRLLAFSRRQVLQPKLIPVNNAVTEMIDLLRRVIGEDIELITLLAPDAGEILVDPGQFGEILMNLAVNSRDAVPGGGRLLIETRNVHLDDDYQLKHAQVHPGDYVMVAVTDTGTGIPPEVKAHIFEPFFTTKPMGKGSGLGLSTVYGIVKQSGGYVWVYSEPGEGTTFKLYFPKHTAGDVELVQQTRGPKNILVIEDDEVIRKLTCTVLRGLGHTVVDEIDGRKALAACESFQGAFDVIITDVSAPGMSGEDLMGFFAVRYPKAAIIHMSGFPLERLRASHAVPADAVFLPKPFTANELIEILSQVLEAQARRDRPL